MLAPDERDDLLWLMAQDLFTTPIFQQSNREGVRAYGEASCDILRTAGDLWTFEFLMLALAEDEGWVSRYGAEAVMTDTYIVVKWVCADTYWETPAA